MSKPEPRPGDVRGFLSEDEYWIILVLSRSRDGRGWRCLTLADRQNPGFEGCPDEQWDDHICQSMPLIQRTLGEDGSPLGSDTVDG